MQITKNFCLEEFERSQTAVRKGIDNRMPRELLANLRCLCEKVLQPLRDYFGEVIRINSGYRCPELNRAVGGAKRSYHLYARAADIPYKKKWYDYIKNNLPHRELLNEGGGRWIHVAV